MQWVFFGLLLSSFSSVVLWLVRTLESLESFRKYHYLGPTPIDSDGNDLGVTWALGFFKGQPGDSNVQTSLGTPLNTGLITN